MEEGQKLHKALHSVHLWGMAVGLVISGDYFGWNFGWAKASFWEFGIAILWIAIFYLMFALCFTELAASIPQAGGPSAYAKRALGDSFGFFTGYLVLVEFLLAPPAIASALGGYIHFLFPMIPSFGAGIGMFLLLLFINLTGIKQTARFELLVTIIAVFGLLLYLSLLLPFLPNNQIPKLPDLESLSLPSILLSIPFAIWFFLAVEGVALAAEEVKHPEKDIPKGYIAGIFTLLVLAGMIFVFTASVTSTEEVSGLEYPLSFVLHKLYGEGSIWPILFTFIGLFGLVASLFGIILGNSRLLYAMSKSGYLPLYLSKLSHKSFVPQNAVLTGGTLGIFCMVFLDTAELISISALGACGMYVFSLVSYLALHKKEPNLNRPYKAPFYPYLPILAIVIGLVAFGSVAYAEPKLTLGVLVVGVILGIGYRWQVNRK
ncbi:ethanolamine permease [Leptospira yanagawae serovar Saopaulo str. Sao Paulo = ATCC 700523]|uniref:Ethanolamine permease n=1 Tax=Leptospira yanagawae serovar Saopaulo str. Sao Paulo = ATCC 700523 TaxID=1249483 RepID=A0A5E8HH41_9LEPT|nr:ethanolamine permease [Leptospira yanagawae]EOQ90222.1 ethanolamine permease [Leptospira yanagawae serovar Saopaulo str. Sao Paulo = ATCC 700523]